MKTICKKSIVMSIILLLIGVSVSSAISVDTKTTISNKESDDCRECNEVSDADLIRVERLLNRVEVYGKLLLVLSSYNTELTDISVELSNRISTLTGLFEELKLNPSPADDSFICDILLLIGVSIFATGLPIVKLYEKCLENGNEILANILFPIVAVLASAIGGILWAGTVFDCDWQLEP